MQGHGVCSTEVQNEAVSAHGYTWDHKGAEDLSPAAHAGRSTGQHTVRAGLPALQQRITTAVSQSCCAKLVEHNPSISRATIPHCR